MQVDDLKHLDYCVLTAKLARVNKLLGGARSRIDECTHCSVATTVEYMFDQRELAALKEECREDLVLGLVMVLNTAYPDAHIMPLMQNADSLRLTGVSVMLPASRIAQPEPTDIEGVVRQKAAGLPTPAFDRAMATPGSPVPMLTLEAIARMLRDKRAGKDTPDWDRLRIQTNSVIYQCMFSAPATSEQFPPTPATSTRAAAADEPITAQQAHQLSVDSTLTRIRTLVRTAVTTACGEGYFYAVVPAADLPVGSMALDKTSGEPLFLRWARSQGFVVSQERGGERFTLHWRDD